MKDVNKEKFNKIFEEYVKRSYKELDKKAELFRKSQNKQKQRYFKNKYNINIPEDFYSRQLEKQSFNCAICGINITELKQDFAIDHNHNTNELRGLLCNSCNLSLGNIEKKITDGLWLVNALKYLLQYSSLPVNKYLEYLKTLNSYLTSIIEESGLK